MISRFLTATLVLFLLLGTWTSAGAREFPPEGVSFEPVVDQAYLPALSGLLASAERRIGMAQLTFHQGSRETREVLRGILAARRRGVEVLVVLDGSMSWAVKKNRRTALLLEGVGARVRIASRDKVVHAKLVVVDEDRALVGSTNLTGNSMARNHETNLLVHSRSAAVTLWGYLEELARDPSGSPSRSRVLEDGRSRVLTDQAFLGEALRAIEGARRTLRVVTYHFARESGPPGSGVDQLFRALRQAADRGVRVELFLERSDYNEYLNEEVAHSVAWLGAHPRIEVRYDTPEKITHAKLIVADAGVEGAERLVMGSTNWYHRGVDVNHQVNLATHDPRVVRHFDRYFQRLFTGG